MRRIFALAGLCALAAATTVQAETWTPYAKTANGLEWEELPGEGADAPREQEQDEIEREQRSKNARAHVRGFGRRNGVGRIALTLPEVHPHGHEPQPYGGKQRRAAPGGDAARDGQTRRAHAPEHEQCRERGKAQRIEHDDGAAGSRLHGGTS